MMSQQKNLLSEADVGSGERTPGQKDTDKMIEQVPDKGTEKNIASDTNRDKASEHTDSQSGSLP